MPTDELIEKAARAIHREHLHTDSLPDLSEEESNLDFDRHHHLYMRMAHACIKVLLTEDMRYWPTSYTPGKLN